MSFNRCLGDDKAPPRSGKPTASGAGPLDRSVWPINSRPYHPRTNGKTGRFFRSVEGGTWHHGSMSKHIGYCNEERLHFSPGIDDCQTPLKAFRDKEAAEVIRESNPGWMEAETDD